MTNQQITFSALNSHYLNTSNNTIDASYLCDAIELWGMNTRRFYEAIHNSKRKITSITWEIFMDLVNDHIKSNEYPYNQKCQCSSRHLKKWLNTYGDGYNTLTEAVWYFEAIRMGE